MAAVGPQPAGTGGTLSLAGSSQTWQFASNVTAEDGSYAALVAPINSGQWSTYLAATNFDFSSIPVGSTINGITVEWKKVKVLGTLADKSTKLVIAGAVSGNDKADATPWGSSLAYTSYGGAADLWGLTPSLAQLQASTFGAAIAALSSASNSAAGVDFCRITVNYTAPSGGLLRSVSSLSGMGRFNPSLEGM